MYESQIIIAHPVQVSTMYLFILHPLVFPLIWNQNYLKMCECGEEYVWLKIISF